MAKPPSGEAPASADARSHAYAGTSSIADADAASLTEDAEAPPSTKFDRDTAVWREAESRSGVVFGAEIAPDWRAGRGPHGGYLAAMLLRALVETVADDARAPRSLTVHYARAPEHGRIQIATTIERQGRSLSTLSARMQQDGELVAIVLAAFSMPWGGPELSDVQMPAVEPPDPSRESIKMIKRGGPEFANHIVLQPRIEGSVFAGGEQPMQIRGWIGLAEPRPIDALSLAFFSDALIPAPYMRMSEPAAVPTVDLTVHFRERLHPTPDADSRELCLAQTTTELVHDGFFIEDGLIWATDGTLLAHSRQLAIVIPFSRR
ncbi:MAG TPA: thioesterase family protein [Solirubrobacteraceae bacterium]|nr:thioesterase family protein [Solirubrobacteraceae bacterium]